MRTIKKGIVILTMLSIMFGIFIIPVAGATATKVSVTIDGNSVTIPANYGAPYIDSANRTQIPISFVAQQLGAKVAWDAATKTATINGAIKIKIGASVINTAYGPITMDTKAVVKDGRTYVPFRFVGNALGYDVNSKAQNGTIVANIVTKSNLTISAAASLKKALTEIQAMYLQEKPNATVTINYGASGTLQQQIEQGAPVDMFFSAATSNMTTLKDKGLLDNNTIRNLLQNKLVLVVPKDSELNISSFADVIDDSIKILALGEPTTVPAGKYASQVFTYFNILDEVKEKAVYGKDVAEVLTWVETGNADAGVVYSTDAKSSSGVEVLATAPDASHDPITYPAAVVKSTKQPVATKDFLNYLTSDVAKAIFVKYGFSVL